MEALVVTPVLAMIRALWKVGVIFVLLRRWWLPLLRI
jgi:hypothetical protein